MKKILIVEDERDVYESLDYIFHQAGYGTDVATCVADAFRKIESADADYDLVLLDMRLPDGDGFTVLRRAKELHMLVMVLSAIEEEYQVASFLDLADDYAAKDTKPRVLLKRIERILNRQEEKQSELVYRNIRIDLLRGIAYKDDCDLFLPPREYKLLLKLMQNIGVPIRRSVLIRDVWDIDGDFIEDNTLTKAIGRLREKIDDDPENPMIVTVRGGPGGYMIAK